jgi:hypothetical protein
MGFVIFPKKMLKFGEIARFRHEIDKLTPKISGPFW